MMKILALTVLLLGALSGFAAAGNLPDGPYVSTSASALEEVAPDYSVLEMQFRTVQDSPEVVRDRTNGAQRNLLAVLEEFEDAIRERRVESMEFGEEFDYDRDQMKRVMIGHYGQFTVRLEVDDFEMLPQLHYRLAGLQWQSLSNPRFMVDDREAVETRLRERAIIKARERARTLAEAGGSVIGKLWGIIHQPMHDLAGRLPDDFGGIPSPRLAVSESSDRFALAMEPRPVRFEVTVGTVFRLNNSGD